MESNLTPEFIKKQKGRIIRRLQKYGDANKILEESSELNGELSPYRQYKLNKVAPHLIAALNRIENDTYGVCQVCGKLIDKKRLELVPAASACRKCQDQL